MEPLVLRLPDSIQLTDMQLLALCELNSALRIEMDTEQNLHIMSPTGIDTGQHNAHLTALFYLWNRRHKLGYIYDSSTGFRLPDGSVRSPDVSFVLAERIAALTPDERSGFAPLCPDFVLELRSPIDNPAALHHKMQTYLANGCRLAWLIDPVAEQACIYRPEAEPQCLTFAPELVLAAHDVLPGFELHLAELLD